ncbi:troponin C, skeletal muscle-like [Montipora capricornis]|uniref:troponin C, skeletal muscle-like n=1 Tax=Montipora capricornis TaxID=246305 RepID=UPI0035F1BD3A
MQAGLSYFDKGVPEVVIRSIFDRYDTNKNGMLEDKEMQNLLQEDLGLNAEQSGIYFLLLDKNGDHNISFEEFNDWLRSGEHFEVLNDKAKFYSLLKAFHYFKTFDTDNSDKLDRSQFETMMRYFGYTTINMDEAFAQMDKCQNGALTFWEFMVWLKWLPVLN